MIKYSEGVLDVLQIIYFLDVFLLMYYGVIYFADAWVRKNLRKSARFVILGVFIPGVNLIYLVMGALDCIFGIRARRIVEE